MIFSGRSLVICMLFVALLSVTVYGAATNKASKGASPAAGAIDIAPFVQSEASEASESPDANNSATTDSGEETATEGAVVTAAPVSPPTLPPCDNAPPKKGAKRQRRSPVLCALRRAAR